HNTPPPSLFPPLHISIWTQRPASSRLEIAREHYRCGIECTSSRHWHLVSGLEHELVHDTKDLLVRLDHARGIEVLANLAEHVAALGIERTHSKGVRIGLGVSACDSQFFSGPYAEELVEANRLLQVIRAVHSIFPIDGRWRVKRAYHDNSGNGSLGWPMALLNPIVSWDKTDGFHSSHAGTRCCADTGPP